ncbi:MAG: polysaccharide deacetylase family protein [candidate division WOR-3 bacterium]
MNGSQEHIWPDDYKFALGLSHDVDETKKTYQYLTHFLKTLRPYHILSFFSKKEPYWNFENIMDLEEKYKVRSTFFFLNEKKRLDLKRPSEIFSTIGRANFLEEKIIEVINLLHNNNWEIGLHGSYDSYKDKELMKKEKKLLEEIIGNPVIGVRQHYLNLKIPKTWMIQKELGFHYDASYGSNNDIGFPDNKYFPVRPFNDDFVVVPLTLMDYVLFSKIKTFDDQLNECRKLIECIREKGGVMVILWHLRVFNEDEFPKAMRVYEEIIKIALDQGGWVTSLDKIVEFYTMNSTI